MKTPKHYQKRLPLYEPIKVIEAWCEDSFFLGNALKYISRAGHKGNIIKDLRKALYYINRKLKAGDSKVFNQIVYEVFDVTNAWNLDLDLSQVVVFIADNKLAQASCCLEAYIKFIKNKNIFNKIRYYFV